MKSHSPFTSAVPVMIFYASVAHSPPFSFVQAEDPKSVHPVCIQNQLYDFDLFLQPFCVRLILLQCLLLSFLFPAWEYQVFTEY